MAAAAAAGAEAARSPRDASGGGGGTLPARPCHLHPRSWEPERALRAEQAEERRARRQAVCTLAANAAEAGVSHRRGDRRESSQDRGGGLQPEKGAANKTRIWSPRGLRGRGLHLAAPQMLGGGNRGAATGGFPCRICQTKGTSLWARSTALSLSPFLLSFSTLLFPLSLFLSLHSYLPTLLSSSPTLL